MAEHRLRLREEVQRLLGEIGAPNPPVVLLEGFDRADRGAVDLVAGLIAEASPFERGPSALFVATVDGAPIGRIAQLARADAARTLTLKPLDRAGVRAFLTSSDAVDAVLAATGGLPELIEELLRGSTIQGPQS